MSKLEELTKELCPNGVEYKTLGELGEFSGGITGKSKNDFIEGNSKFITYMNVYKNLKLNLDVTDKVKIGINENQRTLKYGDILFTGSSETPDECGISSVLADETDEKLYLNSFCICYRFNNPELFNPEFTKYLFRSKELRKQIGKTASGVTRFNVSKEKMKKVQIPIIPLEIQNEIVRILDNFTELEEELEEELEARRKQYEYYRDSLLFENKKSEMKTLNEIGTFERGRRFVHADDRDEGTPCIHYGELYTYYGISATQVKTHINPELTTKFRYAEKNDVVIVAAGENKIDIGVGVAWLGDEKVAIHDACYIFHHEQNPKYIAYLLRTYNYHLQIKKYVAEGKICAISADGLGKAKLPFPPIEEQNRIVKILDRFEALCNDITSGLPAEIDARKKQYEYYRDKLLSFKKMEE